MSRFILLVIILIITYAFAGNYYNINGTKYYIGHPMRKNYHQALRFCALNGMYLVSIHTQENHDSVMAVVKTFNTSDPSIHFWTSGTSLGHPGGEYYWAETGLPLTFTNWLLGAPGSIERQCIILHGGIHKYKWYNEGCHMEHEFICEDKIKLPDIVRDNQCEVQM